MSGILLGWPLGDTAPKAGFTSGRPAAAPAGTPIADRSEAHCLVVAPTGAGKGRNVLIPNLLHWPHTAIVVDIKGEAALATARWRRSLGQRVVVLDPFRRLGEGSDGLNPLDWLAGSPDHLADNATTLSDAITGTALSLKEPFWDHLANDLVAGLVAHATTREDPARRTMGAIFDLLTGDDPVYAIAVLLDTEPKMHPFARRQLAAFLQHESDKVRPSVRSTAQQHLRIFANPLVQAAVSTTTVDLAALQRGEPMTIYLVMPATRLHSHAALLRLWLHVLLGCVAERTVQPECPTLLVVDELGQIGGLQLIVQALTLLRGYGLRVMAIAQSLAQLRSQWPADYQTMIDNCGTIVTFGQNRLDMATATAELLGDVSVPTLMKMPADQLAVNRFGHGTVVARRLDYLRDPLFAGRFDANPFYARDGDAVPA